jgi:hypothetical protein
VDLKAYPISTVFLKSLQAKLLLPLGAAFFQIDIV